MSINISSVLENTLKFDILVIKYVGGAEKP